MTQVSKRLFQLCLGILMIGLAACAPPPTAIPTVEVTAIPTNTSGIPVTGPDLVNTQWTLVSFVEAGTETLVLPGTNVTLGFPATGEVNGSTGCNNFVGQYGIQGSIISFRRLNSTKMACTAQGANEQEQKYLTALQSANRFELSGDTLKIWYANQQNTLNFSKAVPGTPAQPTVSPTTSAPTLANPTVPIATATNANSEERIKFAAGSTSATLTGHLDASESKLYLLRALAGQTMTINLAFTQGQAILVVWGEDGNVLLSDHAEASRFQRVLPTTQDYHIQVKGRPEGSTDYSMTVSIPASNNIAARRIAFPIGSTSATVTGQLNPSASDQYVLNAQARQTMTVNLTFTQGNAILVIWGADGNVLISDHAETSSFEGVLPTTQDYYIMVKGRPDGFSTYNMTITVPPLP